MRCDRVERGQHARVRKRGDHLATSSPAASLSSPGAPQGPRAFCFLQCPAGEIRQTRMPQKHESPGSNPGWGTRIFCEGRKPSPALLQLGCGKDAPPRASARARPRAPCAAGPGGHSPAVKSSRRLTVRTAAFQAANAGSIPAGNANGDVAQSTERSPCKRMMRV
jgi:hypothetical protein